MDRKEAFDAIVKHDAGKSRRLFFDGYNDNYIDIDIKPACYCCWSKSNINAYFPKDEDGQIDISIMSRTVILCDDCAEDSNEAPFGAYMYVSIKNKELTTSIRFSADGFGDDEVIT